ncbi:hypothetical protein BJF89_06625 [Corynebacterium sp. CNJ-954]|uniref:hypothetical protein n=1 Tax=Corynebacterium sp. CNJ-954 TaxID=1904962 RepID=UPI00095D66E7|nr:hypothetical protein [Corynebacterium sp. CNJ-954]OLT51402.1 hypothetical protein BJF89_06625 [Corynebacterium sp. CNJ-954]
MPGGGVGLRGGCRRATHPGGAGVVEDLLEQLFRRLLVAGDQNIGQPGGQRADTAVMPGHVDRDGRRLRRLSGVLRVIGESVVPPHLLETAVGRGSGRHVQVGGEDLGIEVQQVADIVDDALALVGGGKNLEHDLRHGHQ